MKEPQSKVFGLVLAPTRELAMQISQQVEALGSVIQVKCATIVGGLPMMPQAVALAQKPHIIVATPGRLVDHLESTKGFNLNTLKYLVLDEADRLLDLDFGDAINKILQTISHRESERRTYLFSATMSKKVGGLQRASLKDPVRVSISNTSHQTVAQLVQEWLLVPAHQKDLYLAYLLSVKYPGLTVIVFARTINKTQELAYLLRRLGLEAIPIHGELAQTHRLAALNKFRAGSRNILVATDVAARGLDIPSVGIVINYDLPDDCTTYVHRVGRTARAGKSGKAISLVTQYDAELWMRIEHARGSKVPLMENLDKSDVMALATSVDQAQVEAKRELRDAVEKGKKRGGIGMGKSAGRGRGGARGNFKGRRGRDDQDRGER
jgi:ATP-dependent RNA helicase DDX47/RRP3